METKDINGVEIFAAGTWNGDTYTTEDLDQMVAGFHATKNALKPYLKLGHNDQQKITDGLPAIGWIDNLQRVGDKLVADFKKVPKKLYDLISAGAYRRVSSEIFINIKVAGVKFGKLLKAVAILGGDTPAVETLQDIISLYNASLSEAVKVYETAENTLSYELSKSEIKEDSSMPKTIEQLTAELAEANEKLGKYAQAEAEKIASLSKQVADLTIERDAFKKSEADFKKKIEELGEKLKQYAHEKSEIEAKSAVDKLIQDKKIVPAQKEAAFALLMSVKENPSEKKFKVGEKEMTSEEIVLAMFANGKADVKTTSSTKAGERVDGDDLDSKAKKFMEEHKGTSYAEALVAVSPAEVAEAQSPEGDK